MKRKVLAIVVLLIILLPLSFWGYLKYKEYKSYQAPIPRNTRTLVRIDLISIYKSMLSDYPGQKKDRPLRLPEGLSLPANLFFFSLEQSDPATFFTILPVTDISALEHSLPSCLPGYRVTAAQGTRLGRDTSGRITLAYNNRWLAISFSRTQAKTKEQLLTLLSRENTVPLSKSRFKNIRQEEGHISFLSPSGGGSIRCANGRLTATFTFSPLELLRPGRLPVPDKAAEESLVLELAADLQPLLQARTFTIDTFSVQGDSLLRYMPRGFRLCAGGYVTQSDTIITYDYNDDFEKVAVSTVRATKVPAWQLAVQARGKGMFRYLQSRRILTPDSSLNPKIFPLFAVKAHAGEQLLLFGTAIFSQQAPAASSMSDTFARLSIDFKTLELPSELAFLRPRLRMLDRLTASARQVAEQECRLELQLSFRDKKKQSLLQLAALF